METVLMLLGVVIFLASVWILFSRPSEKSETDQAATMKQLAELEDLLADMQDRKGKPPREGHAIKVLKEANELDLLHFFRKQSPQTVAVLLYFVPSWRSAHLIAGLPSEQLISIFRHLGAFQKMAPEQVRSLLETAADLLDTTKPYYAFDTDLPAEIAQHFEPSKKDQLLQAAHDA